jgi:hypothetical protein
MHAEHVTVLGLMRAEPAAALGLIRAGALPNATAVGPGAELNL